MALSRTTKINKINNVNLIQQLNLKMLFNLSWIKKNLDFRIQNSGKKPDLF